MNSFTRKKKLLEANKTIAGYLQDEQEWVKKLDGYYMAQIKQNEFLSRRVGELELELEKAKKEPYRVILIDERNKE